MDDTQSRDESQITVHISGPVVVKQQTDPGENQRYSEERNSREAQLTAARRMNQITVVAGAISFLALVAVYIGLYLTRKQFLLDQRPWALVAAIEQAKQDTKGKVLVPVYVANYGKTPALETAVRGEVFLGPEAAKHAYEFFDAMNDPKVRMARTGSYITVAPGAPPDPTKSQIYTTLQSGSISTEDFVQDGANSMWIVVAVRIDYLDTNGNGYHSEFCVGSLQTGAQSHCTEHNLAK